MTNRCSSNSILLSRPRVCTGDIFGVEVLDQVNTIFVKNSLFLTYDRINQLSSNLGLVSDFYRPELISLTFKVHLDRTFHPFEVQ